VVIRDYVTTVKGGKWGYIKTGCGVLGWLVRSLDMYDELRGRRPGGRGGR